MAESFGARVKDAVGTFFGVVFVVAFMLAIGWVVGFRPIEWVMDMAEGSNAPQRPTTVYDQPVSEPVNAPPYEPPPPPAEAWSCYYDATMNENWHDDVLCARGSERIRPQLLTNKNFVTRADMLAAAEAYEAELNRP